MSGLGPVELLVVAFFALLLFGAPVVAFFLGYVVGKKGASTDAPPAAPAAPPTDTASEPPATESPDTPSEEPVDE